MKKFIYPAKFYLFAFIALLLGLYILVNSNLFQEAKNIHSNSQKLNAELAQSELIKAVNNTLLNLNDTTSQLINSSALKEHFKQNDAQKWISNLKHSPDAMLYLNEAEFYDASGEIMPSDKTSRHFLSLLPSQVNAPLQYFHYDQDILNLIMIKPIYSPNSNTLTGYLGLYFPFIPILKQYNHFMHIDALSIESKKQSSENKIQVANIAQELQFQTFTNPMDSYLWNLIQGFVYEVIFFSLVMTLLFIAFFTLFTLIPLKVLSKFIKQLQKHPNTIVPPLKKTFYFSEFENLKQAIYQYHKQLISAQLKIDEQHQIAYEQARQDSLSHVFNRRAFDEAWDDLLFNYHLAPRNLAFILFDCDFFKAINDTYGHEVGDDVIRISASTFKKSLPLEFNIYRIGGDEFACLVEGKTLEESIHIAQQCFNAISEYDFKHIGIQEKVFYSIGLSFISPEDADKMAFIHKHADIALYQAKKSQNNKVQVYQDSLYQPEEVLVSNKRVTLIVDALHHGSNIQMHKQVIWNIDQTRCYYESLIRIQDDQELIYPGEIFKVVKHRKLETELDKRVIEKMHFLLQQENFSSGVGLSINISAQTLLYENLITLFEPIQPYLKQYKIIIEILEDTLIQNMSEVSDTLNILREKGFKVALDDFGSGYSSIRYLAQMPVDIVKFDISLTQRLIEKDKTSIIIKKTASMIRAAGYDLVMEGIETEAMLQAASDAGATHLQGNYLGKPEPFL